ncbi:aprataxin and PNK-like factor isoform X2 [Scaptodrosophila lebanonensis]|nr:aprataxin and PNK-like factor isoform X2 [Scaptodrosophila lebanonensis]
MDHVNESENESISNEAKAAGSEGSVKRKISADIDNDAENEINTTEQSCCKRLRSGLNNDETNLIAIKTEPQDENECLPETATISSNIEPSEMGTAAVIKQEKTDESDSNMPADGPSNSTATGVSSDLPVSVKTEPTVGSVDVKAEPVANNTQLPADSTVTSTSTNLRQSCRFGVRCYRRNPAHRSAEAHPGDSDYRRPSFPAPPLGTPPCSFGNSCYRRNPVHFQQYSHPPD